MVTGDLFLWKNRPGWKERSQIREHVGQWIGCDARVVIEDLTPKWAPIHAESSIYLVVREPSATESVGGLSDFLICIVGKSREPGCQQKFCSNFPTVYISYTTIERTNGVQWDVRHGSECDEV